MEPNANYIHMHHTRKIYDLKKPRFPFQENSTKQIYLNNFQSPSQIFKNM